MTVNDILLASVASAQYSIHKSRGLEDKVTSMNFIETKNIREYE